MGLRLGTLDYEALQTDYLVDGKGDKKIDFIAFDYDSNTAIVAQGYSSPNWDKPNPSSNKAADLSIALNWLLESDLAKIPRADIRATAQEMRTALESGEITKLEVLYVHNLSTSTDVDTELDTVKRAAERLLERYGIDRISPPECIVRQISRNVVDEWRRSQHETISVQDEVTLTSLTSPVVHETNEWRSVILTVPVRELVRLHRTHGDALSSANVRDYLGSRDRSRNINSQIEKTASSEPENFWIYNNGITLLTHGVEVEDDCAVLQGVAVINGAQTTGSLRQAAEQDEGSLASASVLVRVIKCNDPALVDKVIRYNNTQNPIKAWELRVIDPIQRKLAKDFDSIGINYQTRRGQSRRKATDVHYEKLGPFLSAFYGDPGAAHRNKADLFENEGRYRGLFDDDTHVKNLLFVYRLGNAVQDVKAQYRGKVSAATATPDEAAINDYFRYGAFPFVVLHLCAEVIGLWLAGKEPRYRRRITLPDDVLLGEERFDEVMARLVHAVILPAHQYLKDPERDAYQVTRSQAGVEKLADHVKILISSVEQMNPDNYSEVKSSLLLMNS